MHPIERLRYVARADGAPVAALVRETAYALADLCADPHSLVLAARRVVERYPTTAPLWWLCSEVLVAIDPASRAMELAGDVTRDATPDHLDEVLPDGATVLTVGWSASLARVVAARGDLTVLVCDSHGDGEAFVEHLHDHDSAGELVPFEYLAGAVAMCDTVLVDALACGPTDVLVAGGGAVIVATALRRSVPVTLVAARGTRLPQVMWSAMVEPLQQAGEWRVGLDLVASGDLARVVGPHGASVDVAGSLRAECVAATELLRRSVI
jgi:hypothetical protein